MQYHSWELGSGDHSDNQGWQKRVWTAVKDHSSLHCCEITGWHIFSMTIHSLPLVNVIETLDIWCSQLVTVLAVPSVVVLVMILFSASGILDTHWQHYYACILLTSVVHMVKPITSSAEILTTSQLYRIHNHSWELVSEIVTVAINYSTDSLLKMFGHCLTILLCFPLKSNVVLCSCISRRTWDLASDIDHHN